MAEAISSLLSAGAARFQDWLWPDPLDGRAITVNPSVRSRNGNVAQTCETVSIGGGTPHDVAVLNGVAACKIECTPTAGWGFIFSNAGYFNVKTSRNAITAFVDDTCAKRFLTIMAGSGDSIPAPADHADFGVEFVAAKGGAPRLVNDLVNGWGIRIRTAATFEFIVRGPNGLLIETFALDTTVFHAYEFRIVDATADADAQLTLLVDGNVIPIAALSSHWGAGSNLPPATKNAFGFVGFQSCIFSYTDTIASALYVTAHHMQQAPSILMTK